MNKTMLALVFAGALVIGAGLPAGAQQKSAQDIFTALDADKDQKLNQAEFNHFLDMTGNKDASDDAKKQEFVAWDTNKDGAIDMQEFAAKYQA
jgi:Ca2+-binding EF-hand superfamily protein